MLRKIFGAGRVSVPPRRSIPAGERVYAIGDVHGRLDLLDDLLAQIARDRVGADTRDTLILLGDLIDRGPDSAGVVERLAGLSDGFDQVRLIMGNHEEIFLSALGGDGKALRLFCRVGGRETALSYGIGEAEYERLDYQQLHARLLEVVPLAHRQFLAGFEDMVLCGDYAFVHAGVRPDRPLGEQQVSDLRWIRSIFLDHRQPLEKMIVHGHTIEAPAAFRPHRIGIDTGAYETHCLTALVLEGEGTKLLQTGK